MQFTNNYNLKKPGYSDIADIPEHFNDNMDTIDAKLKENADNISNLEGTGRTTETVKGNSDSIASLAGEGRTTETVKKNADDIGTLSTQTAELEQEVETHKAENVSKVGHVIRDISLVGTQQVRGLGFKPKSLLVMVNVDGQANKRCHGFVDRIAQRSIWSNISTATFNTSLSQAIVIADTVTNRTGGIITIVDDGFDIAWTLAGTGATGNATISYIAHTHGGN